MDDTLTGPTQAVKTAGQTLSWKSKFKHFDLQQQHRPSLHLHHLLVPREREKTEEGSLLDWLNCDCSDMMSVTVNVAIIER